MLGVSILIRYRNCSDGVVLCGFFPVLLHHEFHDTVFYNLSLFFFQKSPSFEDVRKLEYLEMVMHETLRLLPCAPG